MGEDPSIETSKNSILHPAIIMAESTQVPLSPLEQANSAFQVQWNKLMQDDSKFAGIYQNVAVLLISWADELDDLHCGDEVRSSFLACKHKLTLHRSGGYRMCFRISITTRSRDWSSIGKMLHSYRSITRCLDSCSKKIVKVVYL